MALLAGIGGAAVAASPLVGLGLALAVPSGALLIGKASVRLTTIIIGALIVFQGVGNAGKLAYFGVAVICCTLSGVRLAKSKDAVTQCFRPMLYGGVAFGFTLFVSLLVAHSVGTAFSSWFRDALPYILLVILPIVGIDAGRDLTRRRVDLLIAGIGIFAAIGFAIAWLDRRGASTLGVGRLILATAQLAAMAFCYALAHSDRGRRAAKWLAVAAVILALMLVTGTRSVAVFALGFFGVVGRQKRAAINPVRMIAYLAVISAIIAILLPFMSHHLINDPNFLGSKFQNAIDVTSGKAGDDQSYQARQYAYAVNEELFIEHPWLGTGPGFMASLDSPWVVPAKIGIVGVGALLAYLVSTILALQRTRRLVGPLPALAAGRGWLFVLVASVPFAAVPEDKGLALALTLLVAAVCSEASSQSPNSDDTAIVVARPRLRLLPLARQHKR